MEHKMEENKPVAASPQSRRKSFPWAMMGVFFTALAFVVLVAVFCISFYKVSKFGKQLQEEIASLHHRMDVLQADVTTYRQDAQQEATLLKGSISDMQQSQSSDKNAWRIIEAQYYVKLANTNLELSGNVATAIQLLQTADKNIANLTDPKVDVLRKALAEDIVSLQSVSQVDYSGIYMRLAALNATVDKLPLLIKEPEDKATSTETNPNQSWWKRGLSESWKSLQKIIVVRYHASGVPPLITPDQQEFLRQNLHGEFESAMWAVLNKKTDVYKSSLQQTATWISQYFEVNNPVTQNMLNSLAQLQQIEINPVLPKITASVEAFQG